ncbi:MULTISPECIES: hypothetical protein [Chryseobacterium]|jgi:hypothetical protein|nr:hypothetical protein [Chryseobacterium lathyri]
MKTFAAYDFYIQLAILIAGIIIESIGIFGGAFYFVVGIPQLVSFLIRVLQPGKKSLLYIIYGILILPVWISLLLVFGLKVHPDITEMLLMILIGALFYSPVMAVIYIYDNYRTYKSYQ